MTCKTEQFGREALHFMIEFEHLDCVKYLLSRCSRDSVTALKTATPLAYACTYSISLF